MKDILGDPARKALGERGRKCTAANRSGNRCRRAPIPGGFVCVLHGGKIPAVQRTAHERLLAMVDPAFDTLARALRAAPPCEACGRSDADRDPVALRAAQIVLDRAGFHPTIALQNAAPAVPAFFGWIPVDRLEVMQAWMAEARESMERGNPRPELRLLPAIDVDAEPGEHLSEVDTDDHLN